jgi:cobalt/nickel transport system ATP-binding protein
VSAEALKPQIELRDVSFAYHGDHSALEGVSLSVAKGEAVALVGPNGAGKSTLLLSLVGILGARGEVTVGGTKLSRKTLRDIRRRVGLVFQDPDDQLFMSTIAEDVAFGPAQTGLSREEVDARVAEALGAVGLDGLGDRAPHHLSGGEKRAASLATVLSMRPEVFALDEPTDGLDPRARRRAMELLRSLDGACLIATHDLEMVLELCSRAVVMDGGQVIADGPVRDVLADEALMVAHGLEVPLSIRLGG